MSRKFERSMLRKQYDDFCQAWKNEKTYQRIVKSDGRELPEGQVELGRKPTFNMWLTAKKNGTFNQATPGEEDKTVEVNDIAWEE